MQMFEVKNFDVCLATGITSYEMHWDVGRGKRIDRGSFIDQLDAEKYILSSKRSYILTMYNNYLLNVKILIETGHHDFYKTEAKMEALEKCQKYNQWFQDKPLDTICKVILALQEDLRKILPSPNNPTYAPTEEKVLDMVVFCKKGHSNIPVQKKVV